MNSIINAMVKYDHRQHELSDWLLELEQRFQLGEVEADRAKITWCQLLIGATGNSILAGLDADATWEAAKETLLSWLGAGSIRDAAWVALKHLTKGSKEIIELASEAERLAKRLHPRDEEAAERHVVDAFLSALDWPLAAEVRKLGQNHMEGVVADARRIERILQEQPTSGAESAVEAMGRQIQILQQDLMKAQGKLTTQTPATPQAAVLAATFSPAASTSLFDASSAASSHFSLSSAPTIRRRIGEIDRKTFSTSGNRTSGETDGRQDASSVMKRGILPTAALPTHCCNAYSGNRPQNKPDSCLLAKYLSFFQQMVALTRPQYS